MTGGTCTACGAGLPPDARFCSRCGAPVEQEQHSERRLATVLFADIVGSTDMAVSVDPEDLRVRLTAFFETCRNVITDCGGRVEKFIGDAVMAVFGVPRAFGDDVDRAVTAALRLVEAVDVPIRVGVNTGEVLAVETGPEGPVAVTGEAVNAAARLQSAAEPGQVLLGDRTARAVRSHGTRSLGAITVKGFPEPVPVWEAVAAPAATATRAPFLGRDDEIGLLTLAHRRCLRRRAAHLAVVVGEPGAGKSRLAEELSERVAHEPVRRVLLTSSPVESAAAVPALGVLARALCGTPDLPPGGLRQAVADCLTGSVDPAEAAESARWVAVSAGDDVAGDVEGLVDERVAVAWSRLMRAALADCPVTVVVDDVQWADDAVLGVLARALATAGDAPLFVVLLTRPDLERDLELVIRSASHVVRLELLPLSDADAAALVRHLLPESVDTVRERAAARAGGNPFFLHELARVVVESARPGDPLDLPDTVQANVAARLDALPDLARRVIQLASTVGPTFDREVLSALGVEATDETLDLLVRRDFIARDQAAGDYTFRHALIREIAYAQLPRATRAQLHDQLAARVLAGADAGGSTGVALAAEHISRAAGLAPTAERQERACTLLCDAAADARRRGHSRRAYELLEQAADVAPDVRARLDSLRTAAWVAWGRWQGDDTVRLFLKLADAAAEAGDAAMECEAMFGAIEVATRFSGACDQEPSTAELREWYDRGVAAIPAGDARLTALGRVIRCWVDVRGQPLTDDDVDEAVRLSIAAGDLRLQSLAFDTATAHHWTNLRPAAAAEVAARRGAVVERISDSLEAGLEQSDALIMAADTALMVGDLPGFKAAAESVHAFEAPRGNHIVAQARLLVVAFHEARWDDVLALADRLHVAWLESGRQIAGYATPGVWAAAAVSRLRGDAGAEARWTTFAQQLTGGSGTQHQWPDIYLADADVHRGAAADAIARLDAHTPRAHPEMLQFRLAVRAEAAVAAGSDDATDRVAAALPVAAGNRLTRNVVRRASSLLHGDAAELRAAYDEFNAIGSTYQAARTAVWLEDALRSDALALFARLRVPAPQLSRPLATT